jgi:hypothetical protein
VACGWLGYDPETVWKLSPREITYAFKGWEAKNKYQLAIQRNLMRGQALMLIAPTVKENQRVAKDAEELFRFPWEDPPKKLSREDLKSNLPDVLPNMTDWEVL